MANRPSIKLFLVLTLATLACELASPASPTPTAVPVQPIVPAQTAVPVQATLSVPKGVASSLVVERLRNAKYQLGVRDDHAVVQLTNGKFQQGTDTAALDYAFVIFTDFITLGDLYQDGTNAAAAIFSENYGGSENFAILAIYSNVNVSPVFVTSVLIDNRPTIEDLTIGGNEIGLRATTHNFNDPMYCPTLSTTRIYQLADGRLRLRHMRSGTPPENSEHQISISSPDEDDVVSKTIHLAGGITIASIENDLVYRIYDKDGNELMGNSISDPIRPFDSMISLDGIPSGTIIYLEVQELSAKDNTILAMDSVKLLVK